jgi:hypothetical protein
MSDHELLHQVQREQLREIFREVLSERDRRDEEQRAEQERAEQAYLASIRRKDLSPREKSVLIERLGKDSYLALPWGEDQPRDDAGRFRRLR